MLGISPHNFLISMIESVVLFDDLTAWQESVQRKWLAAIDVQYQVSNQCQQLVLGHNPRIAQSECIPLFAMVCEQTCSMWLAPWLSYDECLLQKLKTYMQVCSKFAGILHFGKSSPMTLQVALNSTHLKTVGRVTSGAT